MGGASGYSVQEIRYNGIRVFDNILPLNGEAIAHTLEIVVNDKLSTITGTVSSGDHPTSRPHIVLAKWPLAGDIYKAVVTAAGDEDGRFQIPGLAAGEYRIAAVRREDKDAIEQPNAFSRLLRQGEKIGLRPGGFQNINLKPANSGR